MSEVLTFHSTFPSLNRRHLSPVKNGVVGGAFVYRADIQEIKMRDPIQTESLISRGLSCFFLQLLNLRHGRNSADTLWVQAAHLHS